MFYCFNVFPGAAAVPPLVTVPPILQVRDHTMARPVAAQPTAVTGQGPEQRSRKADTFVMGSDVVNKIIRVIHSHGAHPGSFGQLQPYFTLFDVNTRNFRKLQ